MTVFRRNFLIVITGALFLLIVSKQQHSFMHKKTPWSDNHVARNVPKSKKTTYGFDSSHEGHGLRMKAHKVGMNNVPDDHTDRNVSESKKTIQWFDSFHEGHGLRMKAQKVRMDMCEYSNCELLEHNIVPERDDNIYGPLDADAVIFQGCHLGHFLPPKRRDETQVFVFAERETWWYMGAFERMLEPALNKTEKQQTTKSFEMQMPAILKNTLKFVNIFRFQSLFNWTMTYRRDSDIVMPYGEILSRRNAIKRGYIPNSKAKIVDEKDYERIYYSKIGSVVWLVSDCNTKSKREYYVKQLSQYIDVDIYGKCGTLSCPKQKYSTETNTCLNKIVKEYKFVLSFENTFHTDYVTEKLFDWFSRDIVQVVYGMADYAAITPPGSVINAADFTSPKQLAEYMLQVAGDKNKYVRYLKMKDRHFSVDLDEMQQLAYCKLCEKLNNLDANRRSYPNIGLWWQLNDTKGFTNLYTQAFGVYDNVADRFIKYLFYFISLCCACIFFIATCCFCKKQYT